MLDPSDISPTNTNVLAGEVHEMEKADSADTNYSDGKRYTVEVEIPSGVPSQVIFRFVYSSGTCEAAGIPGLPRPFTVYAL
ncbi:MAG: hypothetical protein O7A08_02875 [SAR324 cluster bacterium]|nr:hypothetical protein [SAR324 cluster bacterium]